MNEKDSNITSFVKNALLQHFSFELVKAIVGTENFGSARYLQLIQLMEGFTHKMLNTLSLQSEEKTHMGLPEIGRLLKYKGMRSIKHWCSKNEVCIITQGNNQFVNRTDFLLAFYKPFVKTLQAKHKDWKERFLNHLEANFDKLLSDRNEPKEQQRQYKAKTLVEKSFMKKIKEL